jgi:hypothetical protein
MIQHEKLLVIESQNNIRICEGYDEEGAPKPAGNIFPLESVVKAGIARVIPIKDDIYIITPEILHPDSGLSSEVHVVVADWDQKEIKEKVTRYSYSSGCDACGAPLVADKTKKFTQPSMGCGYCGGVTKGASPETNTEWVTEIVINDYSRSDFWSNTLDNLRAESQPKHEKQNPWKFITTLFQSHETALPPEVVESSAGMFEPTDHIKITGPISRDSQTDLFVLFGPLAGDITPNENDYGHDTDPTVPRSYIVESTDDATDQGDYVIIIESDSGGKLPLIIMTDRDRIPSRFIVPLNSLFYDGWEVSRQDSAETFNSIIERSKLQKQSSPTSVPSAEFGRVKVFWWNNDSERHDGITDVLDNNDLDSTGLFVSGDIPNGDISAIFIEQTQ